MHISTYLEQLNTGNRESGTKVPSVRTPLKIVTDRFILSSRKSRGLNDADINCRLCPSGELNVESYQHIHKTHMSLFTPRTKRKLSAISNRSNSKTSNKIDSRTARKIGTAFGAEFPTTPKKVNPPHRKRARLKLN